MRKKIKASQVTKFSDNSIMKTSHLQNPKNLFFSYFDLKFIYHKLDNLSSLIPESKGILIIAKTRLVSCFPTALFLISDSHNPLRLDINKRSRGLLVYVRTSISVIMLTSFNITNNVQAVPFRINKKNE